MMSLRLCGPYPDNYVGCITRNARNSHLLTYEMVKIVHPIIEFVSHARFTARIIPKNLPTKEKDLHYMRNQLMREKSRE
jgi:hypothetical protein